MSSSPKSKTCTMFGCTSRAAASASRRKRETNCVVVGEVLGEQLHGDVALEPPVERELDRRHAADAQPVAELVAAGDASRRPLIGRHPARRRCVGAGAVAAAAPASAAPVGVVAGGVVGGRSSSVVRGRRRRRRRGRSGRRRGRRLRHRLRRSCGVVGVRAVARRRSPSPAAARRPERRFARGVVDRLRQRCDRLACALAQLSAAPPQSPLVDGAPATASICALRSCRASDGGRPPLTPLPPQETSERGRRPTPRR